jgi:hypothetical protein
MAHTLHEGLLAFMTTLPFYRGYIKPTAISFVSVVTFVAICTLNTNVITYLFKLTPSLPRLPMSLRYPLLPFLPYFFL